MDNYLYKAQRIKLAGYGSETFAASLAKVEEVFEFVSRHFATGSMAALEHYTVASEAVLTASTRYFTPKSDAPLATDMPFADGVDPMGYLNRLRIHNLIHTEDNRVGYTKRIFKPSTGYEMPPFHYFACLLPLLPAIFCVGDIVEAELYFVVIQRKDRSLKLTIRIQGLTQLDTSFTKASFCPGPTLNSPLTSNNFNYRMRARDAKNRENPLQP
ncbi:hypothetical protein C8J57DRAFT_1100432 [Mycena rebaudengoi]|nr:hypothetical protein C8J57DRAFT_1100432 [Mycena rebaudengoi]